MAWYTVADAERLEDGQSIAISVRGKRIAVFYSQGQYFAIDDHCLHAGAPLAGCDVENLTVTCPWHAWEFRLTDGAWVNNPRLKIPSYAVRLDAGCVQIDLPDPPVLQQVSAT